jgi:uncharacterized protein (TIGR01777 family)
MKILISGSSGFLGSHLIPSLKNEGHEIVRLIRRPVKDASQEIYWNPEQAELNNQDLEGFDVLINLAGENIAARRWSNTVKARIKNSRVNSTQLLADTITRLQIKPKVFISASATGYYGDRGDEKLYENSPAGSTFLAQVCQAWEAAAASVADAKTRVVYLRFGVILSPHSGVLAKMLPAFRTGLGAVIGNGKQYLPWITLEDVLRAITHVINDTSLHGPINVVAPSHVTQAEFSKCLARVLSRPVLFTLPSFILKTTLGQMAQELLLASTRVISKKLINSGFSFKNAQLEATLKSLLGH